MRRVEFPPEADQELTRLRELEQTLSSEIDRVSWKKADAHRAQQRLIASVCPTHMLHTTEGQHGYVCVDCGRDPSGRVPVPEVLGRFDG